MPCVTGPSRRARFRLPAAPLALFIAWVGCAADPREDQPPPSGHETSRVLASDRVAVKVGDRVTEMTRGEAANVQDRGLHVTRRSDDDPPLGIEDVSRAASQQRAPVDVYTAQGTRPPKAAPPAVVSGEATVIDRQTQAKYLAYAAALQQELASSADLPERERRARIAALKRRIVLGE